MNSVFKTSIEYIKRRLVEDESLDLDSCILSVFLELYTIEGVLDYNTLLDLIDYAETKEDIEVIKRVFMEENYTETDVNEVYKIYQRCIKGKLNDSREYT